MNTKTSQEGTNPSKSATDPIIEFTLSEGQPGASIPFTDLCRFGQKLIEALKLEPTDTLGRWMAHYLAERISAAKVATSPEKECLEKEVFAVVLQLWKHRSNWPGHGRPFRETDALAEKLRTFIDVSKPLYFTSRVEPSDPDAAKWMDCAQGIDRTARDLIRWCIDQALADSTGNAENWAEDKVGQLLDDGEDIREARVLFKEVRIIFGDHVPEDKLEGMTRMRDDLDRFMEMAASLREEINKQILNNGKGN